ncbi:hypothetical protein EW146_g4697 [Bondarzewia mesenterica]|uniref:fructose-bisphosphate aldolase n=1 Tax=Bondarzewia mesenterica TaxID=1095465 RepID=A0A4S4LU92_9AGAM|nr:hypothetical protein EW146_g4697 [Bondarzewia mesenterica]
MTDLNATSTPGYTFSTKASSETYGTSSLYPYHKTEVAQELIKIANALVNPRGKGIYATDESPEGIEARLTAAAGEDNQRKTFSDQEKREQRRRWRECLYETLPTDYISGVILYSETLIDFKLAPVLEKRGIIPGMRADTDSHPLPISPNEPATQGLDDLLPRLQAARAAGARFTKWRAPILCSASSFPTHAALEAQAESLARFAAISQQAGLVPIVEPDVDFGADADLRRSVEVHVKIISMIYARKTTSIEEIALATATALARSVPLAVAGIVFLSGTLIAFSSTGHFAHDLICAGGLSDSDAALYLHKINQIVNSAKPPSAFARLPPLTFSFGRGLQGDAMQKWVRGDEKGAKEVFEERAKVCWGAAQGQLQLVSSSV